MSTGHRPTFYPALGKASSINTRQVSVKDQKGHTRLKFRQFGQASQNEMRTRDLRAELEQKQGQDITEKNKEILLITDVDKSIEHLNQLTDAPAAFSIEAVRKKYDDADAVDGDSDRDLESSDEEEDSDVDEELELQRELERIKAERAAAQAKKEKEENELREKRNREDAIKGNPLIDLEGNSSDKVKRRWNDDVVFRNQARDEPEHKKRFINDTIRNDFHRNFLKKFVK